MKNFFLGSLITILLLAGLASSDLKANQLLVENVVIVLIDNSIVVISADSTGGGTFLVDDDE